SSLDNVKGNPDPLERIRSVVSASDRAGRLAWELTADTLLYTAAVAPEIADDIVNIDNAMRWGFNWDVGPFQTWDALGVAALAQRMTAEARTRSYYDFTARTYQPLSATATPLTMAALKKSNGMVKENRGASLVDLGDGVLGVEFHTKMNSVDDDVAAMMRAAVEEAQRNWRAIVIANDAPNFSVGANVAQVIMGAK